MTGIFVYPTFYFLFDLAKASQHFLYLFPDLKIVAIIKDFPI